MSPGEPRETSFRPLAGERFRFRCHPGIECFTRCCAALSLVLTPYDVLRLKKRLGLTSDVFLERFTDAHLDDGCRFPMLRLRMESKAGRPCPFVTPEGCTVYQDRPGACRIYPLGSAAMKMETEREARRKFFLVDEPHCLGFREGRAWTPEDWMAGEGLAPYNEMNDAWLEIISGRRDLGPADLVPRKLQMFSMASYNLDRFRGFLFQSRFFDLFEVTAEERRQMEGDDEFLLQFAFRWLKFSLFGEPTLRLKTDS